jgi:uncharacterized membrane protein YgcG
VRARCAIVLRFCRRNVCRTAAVGAHGRLAGTPCPWRVHAAGVGCGVAACVPPAHCCVLCGRRCAAGLDCLLQQRVSAFASCLQASTCMLPASCMALHAWRFSFSINTMLGGTQATPAAVSDAKETKGQHACHTPGVNDVSTPHIHSSRPQHWRCRSATDALRAHSKAHTNRRCAHSSSSSGGGGGGGGGGGAPAAAPPPPRPACPLPTKFTCVLQGL